MFLIGRCKDFRFIDVIHAKRFKNLGFNKMPDTAFRHHRNRDRINDLQDHIRVRHARHAAIRTDISRHAFKRHHRACAGILRDLGLLGVHDIHDHAAFQHLRQSLFLCPGTSFDFHLFSLIPHQADIL
jgi:hypothetical protein